MRSVRASLLAAAVASLIAVFPAGGAAAGPVTAGPGAVTAAQSGQPEHILSVFGAGPYLFGASLSRLVAAELVYPTEVGPDGTAVATSAGQWAGELLLVFDHYRLIKIDTAAGTVRTLAGARVGMSFAQVDELYRHLGEFVAGPAYVVRVGPMALRFGGHPIRDGVGTITVGPASVVG